MTQSGVAAARPEPPDRSLMSIGEVLSHLRADFPDATISKLRFLEAEGLVEPRRTASGYRKYSWADVARLRYVLTAQRDHYLPLRVIREHLAALDADTGAADDADADAGPSGVAGGVSGVVGLVRPRPALTPVTGGAAQPGRDSGREPAREVGRASVRASAGGPVESGAGERAAPTRLTRAEVCARAGLDEAALAALEDHGLLRPRPDGRFDGDAVVIAEVAAELARFGVQPRHLRGSRAAADREVGLYAQLVTPLLRQTDPAARARAAETVRELVTLSQRLHGALIRTGLRDTLGQ